MGYNGLHTRGPGAPFACSEPISAGFGIGLFAAVTNKALWRIGRWHPSRLGGLGDGTETTIRHEAVVGETPCPENDCSTSRYDRSSLPAQHVHRRATTTEVVRRAQDPDTTGDAGSGWYQRG